MKKLLLILILWAVPAGAQILSTGQGFYEECRKTEPVPRLACHAYLMGMDETIVPMMARFDFHPRACIPASSSFDQRRAALMNYLRDTPQMRNIDTPSLYMHILATSYPCEGTAKPLPPQPKRF